MGTWWSDHPDLEGLARRGRNELIEEASAGEADSEQFRKRRRSIIDVCFEWMSRGDLVTVGVLNAQFEGRIVTAVNDLIVLHTADVAIGVRTDAAGYVRTVRQAAFTGTVGGRDAASFRAYLGRFEVDSEPVRLVGETFDVEALITASTDDHLLVVDRNGTEWMLPRATLAYALSPIAG